MEPIDPIGSVASYVARWTPTPDYGSKSWALDVPCGRGRHAFFLARLGYKVIAVDNDPSQLKHIEFALGADINPPIRPVLGDARLKLPFEDQQFALLVVFHFVCTELLLDARRLLRPGGRLIFGSYPGHGENWRQLPKAGEITELLAPAFKLLDYQEQHVGPQEVDAVTVRAAADLRA